MQICTSPQTDNHAPPFRFLQAGCPSCRPTNSVKALKDDQKQQLQNQKVFKKYTVIPLNRRKCRPKWRVFYMIIVGILGNFNANYSRCQSQMLRLLLLLLATASFGFCSNDHILRVQQSDRFSGLVFHVSILARCRAYVVQLLILCVEAYRPL